MRIAFSGKKGSGKSTASSYLVDNKNFEELSFADPLKRTIIDLFNIDEKYCYDTNYKEAVIESLNVSGRQLMTTIGTELFNVALLKELPELKLDGGNIWVHNVIRKIKANKSKNIVISDLRFEHERKALKSLNFVTVMLSYSDNTLPVSSHISEAGVDCDYYIDVENRDDLITEINKILSVIETK